MLPVTLICSYFYTKISLSFRFEEGIQFLKIYSQEDVLQVQRNTADEYIIQGSSIIMQNISMYLNLNETLLMSDTPEDNSQCPTFLW